MSTMIREVRDSLCSGRITPLNVVREVLQKANSNQGKNVYLWLKEEDVYRQAQLLESRFPDPALRPPLYGIPVSLKDCFDLQGTLTSCGTRFYAHANGIAAEDSWVAARLQELGAIIVGKTHLHPLAYGITGENPEYGDCVQPKNPARLTGGSSSGAAASVQEGSALAAIGTDTGGSIRVPAALCGLAGYRSSLGKGSWSGGAHLAQSFDTIGWLYRNLEDGPLLGTALFDLPAPEESRSRIRAAVVSSDFLEDCEQAVLTSLQEFMEELKGLDAEISVINVPWWTDLREIFAGIQAHEAAKIHAGHFDAFEPAIRDRLLWGASLSDDEVAALRGKHEQFRERMDTLLRQYDMVVLPAAPVGVLAAGADHSTTRQRLLRYTVPASLAGVPVVTVPMPVGGMQLLSAWGKDSELLSLSAEIGKHRRS